MSKVVKRILLLGDVHLPYEHAKSVDLAFKIAKVWKPTHIVQLGDLLDGYSLNRFGINPRRADHTLATEIEAGQRFIERARGLCDVFHMLEGNHEYRLKRALESSPEFASTHPGMRELLELERSEWTPYGSLYKLGDFHLAHDVGKAGINAAKDSYATVASNLAFGHTHRAATFYGGNMKGERHCVINVGWLGDAKYAEYASDAQKAGWVRGVGKISMLADGRGWADFIPFLRGAAVLNDKVISV